MVFDWDDAKDEATRAERGFGFADAAGIFLGRRVEWPDTRRDYGEVRMVTVGEADGLFYATASVNGFSRVRVSSQSMAKSLSWSVR